jgi:UMF1 family MFS transporter
MKNAPEAELPQDQTAAPPLSQPPVTKREIFGWCMYDVADSAFTTVIITAFYAPYFSKIVVGDRSLGDFYWAQMATWSEVIVALTAPVLGAIADFSGMRKRFLGFCALTIIAFTGSLYFIGPGMIWQGLVLLIIANIGFAGGGIFIDSFLPGISTEANVGRISGTKWALGYLSGLVATALCLGLSRNVVDNPTPEQLASARLIPVVVAVYYMIAVIPTLLLLRERSRPKPLPPGENYFTVGFKQFRNTISHIRRYQDLFRLLIAFLVYNDGVVTVIYFAALYASGTLNFTVEEFGVLLVIMNVVAAAGAFSFGFLADRIGQKKTIFISLAIWLIAIIAAYLTDSKQAFYMVAGLVGIGMGSTQSVTRSLFALFTPKENAAEFFGFLGIAGKALAFAGPQVFGIISRQTGSQRPAILSVGAFFVIGMILLSFVDEKRGKEASRIPVRVQS